MLQFLFYFILFFKNLYLLFLQSMIARPKEGEM